LITVILKPDLVLLTVNVMVKEPVLTEPVKEKPTMLKPVIQNKPHVTSITLSYKEDSPLPISTVGTSITEPLNQLPNVVTTK